MLLAGVKRPVPLITTLCTGGSSCSGRKCRPLSKVVCPGQCATDIKMHKKRSLFAKQRQTLASSSRVCHSQTGRVLSYDGPWSGHVKLVASTVPAPKKPNDSKPADQRPSATYMANGLHSINLKRRARHQHVSKRENPWPHKEAQGFGYCNMAGR